MRAFASPDWGAMFGPTVSLLEIVLRGSVIYLFIFAVMRLLRREAGGLGAPDILLLVLVADAAQNAMAAEYHSLTEGAVLIATIFGWNYLLDWLGYRYKWARRLLIGSPLPLVRDGRILWRNLKKELLTRDDLMEQLREQGVAALAEVKAANLEADGRLSVIRCDPGKEPRPNPHADSPRGAG